MVLQIVGFHVRAEGCGLSAEHDVVLAQAQRDASEPFNFNAYSLTYHDIYHDAVIILVD